MAGSFSSFRFQVIYSLQGEAGFGHGPWAADSDMQVCIPKSIGNTLGIIPVKGVKEA